MVKPILIMEARKKIVRFLLCLTLLFFILSPAVCFAVTENKTGNEDNNSNNKEFSNRVQELVDFLEEAAEDFTYQRKDRPDPFTPFLPQKPVVVKKKEIDEKELKGLRRFEPGQLSLVAIIFKPEEGESKAMVQNAAGKGFIIRAGTKIGRYGIVDQISTNIVTVKEEFQMSNGQSQTKVVKMLLKKEGEE